MKAFFEKASVAISLVVCCSMVSSALGAQTVDGITFKSGYDVSYQWRWSTGGASTSTWGGALGAYDLSMGDDTFMGYSMLCFPQSMTTGSLGDLTALENGYRAAWLMDQYSVGLGNAVPSGFTEADVSAALALAIHEVGMSPSTDPLTLGGPSGTFYVEYWLYDRDTYDLAESYLTALSAATLNQADLESRYDLLCAEENNQNWGPGYAKFVVRRGLVDSSDGDTPQVPIPASFFLVGSGALGLFRKRRVLS